MALKNRDKEVIDLKGKLLLPGFNDSHMHLVGYSLYLDLIDLQGINSIEDIINRCRNEIKSKEIEKGKWIRGRGWN